MLQFTDIPRPGILGEYFESFRADMRDIFVVLFRKFLQKMVSQRGDIFPPLPQGRKGDGDHIESIEEVLPEFTIFHERF
jgi:hypothetical protein